ncbi:hypothetical protein Syun_009744 [Stephania yunnanensis]|uniref:HECT-type E3 ubiquitin transferase n=1 Tax=Stephania yunnanensis TaxID=152371 RepID=A0AAP0PR51_9MAGN
MSSADCHNRKRKLEDFAPTDEDFSADSLHKMKKDQSFDSSSSSATESEREQRQREESAMFGARLGFRYDLNVPEPLHFFVRMMSGGNTIVIHARSDDSVESVHRQIMRITGIPLMEQRLIYRGKQLQWEQKLADCAVQNDAGLQLVGRMRSTGYPKTWQVVDDLVSFICRLCKKESPSMARGVLSRVEQFIRMIPNDDDTGTDSGHVHVFKSGGAPSALVMLFLSPIEGNKECSTEAIEQFVNAKTYVLPQKKRIQCVSIVLEFCKLLSKTAPDDPLYFMCRRTLASLLETIRIVHNSKYFKQAKPAFVIQELFPFVRELANMLINNLDLNVKPAPCAKMDPSIVRDFVAFVGPMRNAIEEQVGGKEHIPICLLDDRPCYVGEIGSLHVVYLELLESVGECLEKVENILKTKRAKDIDTCLLGSIQYLTMLKELNNISKLYEGAEERLHTLMKSRQLPLNALIRYSKKSDNHQWLLEYKDVTFFESRRHLIMMLFPDIKEDYEEMHEMLIDRADLLVESFRYITQAEPEALRSPLFMEFKHEEATGPGVLREWFYRLCQEIFNPENGLFISCPNDQRRFYPNPASRMNPEHLNYFGFCGRVIALALMHKVQVGIAFDRVFFSTLAGRDVCLEDVQDADPYLYMSCKKILEMDADFLDSDGLGLCFVTEIEEFGSKLLVELCPGGKDIALNSQNREEYVKLLLNHRFMTSISEQITHFAQGFADILSRPTLQPFFFQSLDLEDLDKMLRGNGDGISVDDWKAHTDYNGYKETDCQISWFWKLVKKMSEEQKRALLVFWTSLKYLPVEGFRGLQSRLYIYKVTDCADRRLPTSHTCFFRLCLPAYQSLSVMDKSLQIITQEHVTSSFGIW